MIGNRPAGLLSPNKVSAIARPPNSPGYHASRIAGTCRAAQAMLSGRPFCKHQHDGLAGAADGFQKFFLFAGKIQIGAIIAFAGYFLPFAQAENHHICLFGNSHGLV